MRGMRLCVYLALMLVVSGLCQGRGFGDLREQLEEGKGDRDLVALSILNRNRGPGSLQRPQLRPSNRKNRLQRPAPLAPKRNPQGPRFALSLDVPTSILSALIDLAKNREMRTKAAANAQLMARIGKRK
ncbi:urocortin-3-like [Conger conger]|uniref:urocortin-3-like n=1 Tax=Conger conger TaxID=82655 RepID=UPI002A5A282C|nr:urocortin-3-like [Conger conger]